MSDRKATRVERGIYYKPGAGGKRLYEILWRDSAGCLKRRATGPKISVARRELTAELAKRDRREPAPTNPRLSFGKAMDGYFENAVADLRDTTRDGHRWAIDNHLRPRFGSRRMDRINADEWASFIRDCRIAGLAEGSIETILRSARGTYGYAARRLGWTAPNTLAKLERRELPSPGEKLPHRLFTEEELAATLQSASSQNRIVFAVAGTVGSRISESLGLTEDNLDLADLDDASVRFTHQVTRQGQRVPLKTEAAKRTIEIPRSLAVMLADHMARTANRRGIGGEPRYVFCSCSGRPLSQRNVSRELRRAMKAATFENGSLAFPILSETDQDGKAIKVKRGVLPSFHSFRHTAASQVIAEGDGAEEASWLLGHADSTVTRRVYIEQIASAERSSKRRAKLEARMGSTLAGLGAT
ncbi:MAG TPA: tyrosine-type recombinase/integrase [Solirubrobacterales bacterium]|jgi:integrase